jgi:hypothetical protein
MPWQTSARPSAVKPKLNKNVCGIPNGITGRVRSAPVTAINADWVPVAAGTGRVAMGVELAAGEVGVTPAGSVGVTPTGVFVAEGVTPAGAVEVAVGATGSVGVIVAGMVGVMGVGVFVIDGVTPGGRVGVALGVNVCVGV